MDLPIHLDKQTGIPLYVQIEQEIRLLVHLGTLKGGDPMPTVRALAVALEINSNTVARVYRDLERAGLLVLRRGIGTFVAGEARSRLPELPAGGPLEEKIAELVQLARRSAVSRAELIELVEARWKEVPDAQG